MIVMRRNDDGTGTFFDPDTGERINVNRTGRCIWEYLDGGGDERELAAYLSNLFNNQVPPNINTEIDNFIKSLISRNFLTGE